MSPKFFGQYLVDRGLLTREQLMTALNGRDDDHLARLAVARGILLSRDAEKMLAKASPAFDVAETAVRKGLMTQEQADYLRFVQKSDVRRLCAVLTEYGTLSAEALNVYRAEFERDQAALTLDAQQLPATLTGRSEIVALVSMTKSVLEQHGIRPLQLLTPVEHTGNVRTREITVRIRLSGDRPGSFVLSVDRGLAVIIAGQLFGGADLTSDAILRDAEAEFCNLIVGAAASALAARGRRLEFGVPKPIETDTALEAIRDGGRWEIETPWGGLDLFAE